MKVQFFTVFLSLLSQGAFFRTLWNICWGEGGEKSVKIKVMEIFFDA